MLFAGILSSVTFLIAFSAAFFSVYGLSQTFPGMTWFVVVMGASLEAGKLVTASFLYRYWDKVHNAMRYYLMAAVAVLMVITSIGIYGMLSAGYMTDTIELRQTNAQVDQLEQEIDTLQKRKVEIDKQIASLPVENVRGRQKLISAFNVETQQLNQRLPKATDELRKLKTAQITQQAHTGPLVFIANVFGGDVDSATNYLIILIVMVFDPLAVVLTVGVNIVLADVKRQRLEDREAKRQERIDEMNAAREMAEREANHKIEMQRIAAAAVAAQHSATPDVAPHAITIEAVPAPAPEFEVPELSFEEPRFDAIMEPVIEVDAELTSDLSETPTIPEPPTHEEPDVTSPSEQQIVPSVELASVYDNASSLRAKIAEMTAVVNALNAKPHLTDDEHATLAIAEQGLVRYNTMLKKHHDHVAI